MDRKDRVLLGCLLAILAQFTYSPIYAQLNAGELMFVAFNADGDDGFAVAALVDIPANSTIYFNDNEWNELAIGSGGAFNNNNETELTWTTGGSVIDAGTVITFDEVDNSSNTNYGASVGTLTGTLAIAATNEVVYMFLGTNDETPTAFITAIANDGYSTSKGSLVNTGLTSGTNAVSISGDEDVMVYTGSTTCNSTLAACMSMIATSSDWDTQDGSGTQHDDAVFPDFPDDVPGSFGGTVLPVEFTSFAVAGNADNSVSVSWSIAWSIDCRSFTIERSSNALDWNQLERITPRSQHCETEHRIIDRNPASGVNYYRIQGVSVDGRKTYSSIKSVVVDEERSMHLFPAIANDVVNIWTEGDNIHNANIVSTAGVTLSVPVIESNPTQLAFDVSSLSPGLYFLIVQCEGVMRTRRFVKQ